MSRQSLPIGQHGNIKTKLIGPKLWRAQCRVRDADGETRQVKRTGGSKAAAENALQRALSERQAPTGAGALTGDSRIRDAAVLWFEQRQAELDAGELAPNTLRIYRGAWRLHVEPALGAVRLREMTVARCEAWQIATRKARGASPAKQGRAVLSGVLGYAARMGAIATNPCRDLSRIPGKPRRRPRSMTKDERLTWLEWMENHAPLHERLDAAKTTGDTEAIVVAKKRLRVARAAARWDIPDLTRFMLSTGVRVGEALAVTWDDVDFDAGTVNVVWKLIRIEGDGLHRMPGTKRGEGRLLRLPRWSVTMLLNRRISDTAGWPVFPDSLGGWRDPSNVLRVLREARDEAGFDWVTSHVWRKTCATVLDEAGLSAREIADQLEHADPSLTQRVYMGRGIASPAAADALEDLL